MYEYCVLMYMNTDSLTSILNFSTANPFDEKAAKEEGWFSDGGSQSRYSPKEPKAQSCTLWWNTSVDQPIPEQHFSEWLVLE